MNAPGALPKAFVEMHAQRFGLASVKAPLLLNRSRIRAIASKAALMDAGVAWLFDMLGTTQAARKRDKRPLPKKP